MSDEYGPNVQQAKVTSITYHAGFTAGVAGLTEDTLLAGTTTAHYLIRDTTAKQFTFPMARPSTLGSPATPTVDAPGRVVDMGLGVASTLTRVLGAARALAAAGDTVTSAAHGLTEGRFVVLSNVTGGGVAAGTYVVVNPTTNTFQLSTAVGAAVTNITADGTADVAVGVDVGLQLVQLMDLTAMGGSVNSSAGTLISTGPGVDDLPYGGRYWLQSEASASAFQTATFRWWGVPELRMPLDAMRVQLTARETPDAGMVLLRCNRRY